MNIKLLASSIILSLGFTNLVENNLFNLSVKAQSNQETVIKITQTGCQFIETEAKNYEFMTTNSEDCKTINQNTLEERQSGFTSMSLPAGDYVFQVSNENVPYEVGFYLRGQGISRVTLPSVSGGGLIQGTTKEYSVSLKPGKYWISCPLNPTPDYALIVY